MGWNGVGAEWNGMELVLNRMELLVFKLLHCMDMCMLAI